MSRYVAWLMREAWPARVVLVVGVLVGSVGVMVSGCHAPAVQEPPARDAVESWATPMRPPATAPEGDKKKDSHKDSFFFNEKSRDIEKSLGL